jgi:hypothetical protein
MILKVVALIWNTNAALSRSIFYLHGLIAPETGAKANSPIVDCQNFVPIVHGNVRFAYELGVLPRRHTFFPPKY